MNLIEKSKLYRESPSLNQSKLNWIRNGFRRTEVNDGMRLGNIMEALMCYPEEFDNMFLVSKKPSGKGAEIVEQLYRDKVDLDNLTDEQVKYYCVDFHEKRSIDSRHNELLKLRQYWLDLQSDKEIVDQRMVDIVKSKLDRTDYNWLIEGATFQEWIEFEFMGEKCKALIDVVNSKWYDIKSTTKSLLDFPKSIKEYGYDVQAYWYYLAMSVAFPKIEFGGYYVVPLLTNEPAKIFKWDVHYGRDTTLNLVERFKWHRDNNVWYSHLLLPDEVELIESSYGLTFNNF